MKIRYDNNNQDLKSRVSINNYVNKIIDCLTNNDKIIEGFKNKLKDIQLNFKNWKEELIFNTSTFFRFSLIFK